MKKWLRIGPWLLSRIIFLVLAVNLPFLLNSPDLGVFTVLLGILLFFGLEQMELFVMQLLLEIHLFFDREHIYRESKYEANHLAWASILIGVSYILLGYKLDIDQLKINQWNLAFIVIGCLQLSHGIWHFFIRPKVDYRSNDGV